jgi:hypothetical protein
MGTHVWLRNPETGGEWECPNDEGLITYYTARGWERFEPPTENEEPAPVAPASERKPRTSRSTN